MLRHLEAIPGFAQLDARGAASWYPGKRYPGLVSRAQAALREAREAGEVDAAASAPARRLTLESVERRSDDVLWLRFRFEER